MTDTRETWFLNTLCIAGHVFIKMLEIYMKNLVERLLMNSIGSDPNCFK